MLPKTYVMIAILLSIVFSATSKDRYKLVFDEFPPFQGKNYCKSLKVIDLRKNKTDVQYLKTPQHLDVFLETAYNTLNAGTQATGDELVMIVYRFDIQDSPGGLSVGTFSLSADFCRGHDGQYDLITSIDSLYEARTRGDVKIILMKMTRSLIYSFLQQNGCKLPTKGVRTSFSLSELVKRRSSAKLAYPIYNVTEFKKGIYYTCDQFLNNTPIDTPLIKWSTPAGVAEVATHFYYRNERGKRGEPLADAAFFVIYDGHDLWVGDRSSARRLKYVDGDFYTYKLFDQAYIGNDASATGLIGVIAEGTTAGWGEVKRTWELYKAVFEPSLKRFSPVERPHK